MAKQTRFPSVSSIIQERLAEMDSYASSFDEIVDSADTEKVIETLKMYREDIEELMISTIVEVLVDEKMPNDERVFSVDDTMVKGSVVMMSERIKAIDDVIKDMES